MHNQNSSSVIPDSFLEAAGIMQDALRSVRDIEKRLSRAREWDDLDPRLQSELQSVSYATAAMTTSLLLMGATVKDVLKEIAGSEPSHRKPLVKAKQDREREAKASRRLATAEAAVRRRFPQCSDYEIDNRAKYLAMRIDTKESSENLEAASVADIDLARRTGMGVCLRHDPGAGVRVEQPIAVVCPKAQAG